MSRISTYALDADIIGTDKWIGTSANSDNATKNFSVNAVAAFLNSEGIIESQALRYTYQDRIGSVARDSGTISFLTSIGSSVAFSTITSWMLSAYAKTNKDVHTFYNSPLIASTVLVTNAANPSNWAIYVWDSSSQVVLEPNFYDIGLTYISGSGNLVAGQQYLISLLSYDDTGSNDKNFVFTQTTPSSTWVIDHNLAKYCSVSIVDTAGEVVYGEIQYNSINQVTLTFSEAFSGDAFCN